MKLPFLSDEDFSENCPPQTLCSVCGSNEIRPFMLVGDKYYWTCNVCKARILSCKHWLSKKEEFKYYQTHENISSDPAYQRFAAQLALPILDKLIPNSSGLDFGCGPDSALSAILRQHGHNMTVYDPFFFPAKNSLKKTYDFIVCSEAAEHFHQPAKEFKKFNSLLNENGWIGIMTNFQTENARFKNWHYRRDPTHVVFYRKETFEVIGKQFRWTAYFPSRNVVIFQKTRQAF
ncbi:MAG: class I SAM-dependent methyltransferase [Thalassobaculaceae bacterium]